MRISDWSSDVCSSDLAVGEWAPNLRIDVLHKGLRAMLLTRAYDTRMVRVQRQGKTSFYMKSTGEEAVAVAAALALDNDDMCFPNYRQKGLQIGSALCRERVCEYGQMSVGDLTVKKK